MLHGDVDRKKGYMAAVCFSILVGFSFLGIKVCQSYTDSLNLLCYRYDFAFVVIMLLVIFRVIKLDIANKPKKKLLLTAGFYVGFMALQVVGLSYATSVEGSIIFAIVPIIVKIIASIFLKEKSSWLANVFICLTVASLIFMIVMGATKIVINPIGTVLLLFSSVSMALSNVFMRYTRNDYKPIEITFTIVILGFIAFNTAMVIRSVMYGDTIGDYFAPLAIPQVFVAAGYLGIGCILLSAHLTTYMLGKLEAAKGTIFGNVSTAISIVVGAVVLDEALMWYHIVCTVVIIAGVVGLSLSGSGKAEGKDGEKQDGKDGEEQD